MQNYNMKANDGSDGRYEQRRLLRNANLDGRDKS